MRGKLSNASRANDSLLTHDRREFHALLAGLGASLFGWTDSVAGPFLGAEFEKLVPADKNFSAEWLASLAARGKPETFTGDDLKYIGMPAGGIATGTLYLGGDGRLWLWDIFNRHQEGIDPKTVTYAGQSLRSRDGSAYVAPPEQIRPVDQGFEIRVKTAVGESVRTLDRSGFRDVTFNGQYPVGTVTYRDDESPVSAKLEAFSPFIPLDAEDSALPATVMTFTLTNDSQVSVEATLAGWLENAVCLHHRQYAGTRHNRIVTRSGFTYLDCMLARADASVEPLEPNRAGDEPLEELADFGTMGLALIGEPAERQAADVAANGLDGKVHVSAECQLAEKLVGSIGRTVMLNAGEVVKVSFVLVWHFPNLTILDTLKGRHYAARFADATAVAAYVAKHFDRLTSTTLLWRDTWCNSTLPHWFLNRTFTNTSTLATSTCYWLEDGRFWAWEGVGDCPGTCTHVWHYAQAMGRIFPQLERGLRERVDFGLAFDAETGVIRYRGEFGDWFAADGQCGTILRAYREHQMSADDAFLKRVWPRVRQAMQRMMAQDKDRTGIVYGPMHNTLDADWYGVVPWLVGLYHAALRASEEMALEIGDAAFARECRDLFEKGVERLDRLTWKKEYGYYIHLGDPDFLEHVGSYDGCHVDQVLGQSWAWQVGLGRIGDEAHIRQALQSLWRFSVTPDVGPYREANKPGRWYAMPGDGGLLMVTFPFGKPEAIRGAAAGTAQYFNECMSGFEWQAAAHMIWEGMTTQGLAVARLIHDRYHPRLRNPYNEIECSDHYARAMASYGAYLAACGFAYHGPKAHIAFAPRLTPNDFQAAFTAAEGWGTLTQTRRGRKQSATLKPKYGAVRCKTFGLELPAHTTAMEIAATIEGTKAPVTFRQSGSVLTAVFEDAVNVEAGETLELTVTYS
ncbi:MAG: hypothetical protein L0228_13090 [Planctomycetes bacterium]|nr:hypothetical protein [Planctomycetota bacterium]